MKQKRVLNIFFLLFILTAAQLQAQQQKAVIAYYSGSAERLDSFNVNQITHLIYCFGHLKGNKLHIGNAKDTTLIQKMVAKKKENPQLKVLLSLGGWGGCETCSDVFGTAKGRAQFAASVKKLNRFLGADGIDLDWEYPTIAGYPGHRFSTSDKAAFTALVKQLRTTLGPKQIITFAAGGFQAYIDSSVDWQRVMPYVDYVNLMTYDLVSGYATTTGHHTALYSTAQQHESTDNCVQALLKKGIDPKKLIIGAAFYARTWEGVSADNKGLYQSGKFKDFIDYHFFDQRLSATAGFEHFWDSTAHAPYAYNAATKTFATFDNKQSIAQKAAYVLDQNLGGMMFWELSLDTPKDGLLQTINNTLKKRGK